LANAINKLAEDEQMRNRLGVAGSVYAEANLNKDTILAKLEENLMSVVMGDNYKAIKASAFSD